MKTKIHYYTIDTATQAGKDAYSALKSTIKANSEGRGHWMKSIPGQQDRTERVREGTHEIEIDPSHVFDNQWNTATLRVFDWYEEAIYVQGRENKTIKRGHWLTITPEMAKLRADTCACGYCGKLYGPLHAPKPKGPFCEACLGSEFLQEKDLPLLRLVPVLQKYAERAPLTEGERNALLPRFQEMRQTCDLQRASAARAKERAAVIAELEEFKTKKMEHAQIKHDGLLWIWEHGFSTSNWIYYSHTGTFCYGWRELVSEAEKDRWLEVASEFPFAYEVKSVSGAYANAA